MPNKEIKDSVKDAKQVNKPVTGDKPAKPNNTKGNSSNRASSKTEKGTSKRQSPSKDSGKAKASSKEKKATNSNGKQANTKQTVNKPAKANEPKQSPAKATPLKGDNTQQKAPANAKGEKNSGNKPAPIKAKPLVVQDQLFSWEEARKIASLDVAALTTNEQAFIKANQFQYYLALNCWAAIVIPEPNYSQETLLRSWLLSNGLKRAMDLCKVAATSVIEALDTEGVSETPLALILSEQLNVMSELFSSDDPGEVLMKLRFLNRFTPTKADKLEADTLAKFKQILHDTNWGLVEKERSADPGKTEPKLGQWGDRVKKYLGIILKDFKKYYNESSYRFSSGNCTDGKNLVQKLAALSCCQPDIEGLPLDADIRRFGIGYVRDLKPGNFLQGIEDKRHEAKRLFIPEVGPVPKNIWGYRIIGPESSYVSFHMQRVREALVKCMANSRFSKMFDVKTQEPNQNGAFLGSLELILITVDLTSASDLMAKYVMRQLLPDDVWETIEMYLPVAINVGNKLFPPSIFLTSGNPATFQFLGILILSCALAARDLHKEYCPKEKPEDPIIFGDDAVLDIRISEEFFSILEHLGLRVNYSKTFSGHYRESCGVEYVDGYPTTTDYWPRKVVKDPRGEVISAEDFTSIIKLQHRLFGYKRAKWFLTGVIYQIYPQMTTSPVGVDSDDLWSEFITANDKFCRPPIDREKPRGLSWLDVQPKDLPDGMIRRRHVTVKAKESEKFSKLSWHARCAVESYMLYRFLVTGPQYSDDSIDLLMHKVSEPRRVEMEAYKPVNTLSTTVR